jgi:ubiquinol-cytochrome c reductase cytochrome c subunit
MRVALVLVAALALALPASADNGKALFGRYCASCHGPSGEGATAGLRYGGSQGRNNSVQVGQGPSLVGVGELAADFYLRTGYMPLKKNGIQPRRSRLVLNEPQIDALIRFVGSLGNGPKVVHPHPERGDIAEGMRLFRSHCAGCHQIVAQGGYITNAVPPALGEATPEQIYEAIRIGPYVMPKFTEKSLSDAEVNSIIRYVLYAKHPDNRGGWALGNIGPIPEGLVSWFLAGTVLIGICLLLGKRLKHG